MTGTYQGETETYQESDLTFEKLKAFLAQVL